MLFVVVGVIGCGSSVTGLVVFRACEGDLLVVVPSLVDLLLPLPVLLVGLSTGDLLVTVAVVSGACPRLVALLLFLLLAPLLLSGAAGAATEWCCSTFSAAAAGLTMCVGEPVAVLLLISDVLLLVAGKAAFEAAIVVVVVSGCWLGLVAQAGVVGEPVFK